MARDRVARVAVVISHLGDSVDGLVEPLERHAPDVSKRSEFFDVHGKVRLLVVLGLQVALIRLDLLEALVMMLHCLVEFDTISR